MDHVIPEFVGLRSDKSSEENSAEKSKEPQTTVSPAKLLQSHAGAFVACFFALPYLIYRYIRFRSAGFAHRAILRLLEPEFHRITSYGRGVGIRHGHIIGAGLGGFALGVAL